MSFEALTAALSGLRVAQQQLSVISNNVANATTPGYSRKILPQTTQVIDSTGQIIGVRGETVIRRVDLNLEKELWTQISATSALDVRAAYLDRIEKFHGPTQNELSIAAQIAELKNKFSALSDSPADGSLLRGVLDQADLVARKFNEFGQMVTEMRNDTQTQMVETVNRINELITSIGKLNGQIKGADNLGRSVAGLEDERDIAIKELSTLMDLTMFQRGDGVLIIQTANGTQLTEVSPILLHFDPEPIGSNNFYPTSVNGIYSGGDPDINSAAIDITSASLGGKLGALIELRDETLVQYQAQIDELAHKLALRLEKQGLRLFTDPANAVPLDTPPDATLGTPVTYVGFASVIQVNEFIRNDLTLIQQGTYTSDVAIPTASNEVIRRVVEFGFGTVEYKEIDGLTDLRHVGPATDLQTWLGLRSQNNVVMGIDLGSFPQIDDGVAGGGDIRDELQDYFPNWPNNDQFRITFSEPRLGLGPTTITVDLSNTDVAFPLGPGVNDALDQIIGEVNAQIALAGLPAGLLSSATRNSQGQLVINSRGNVRMDASSFVTSMGTTAFEALGLQEGTFTTEDPYFDIQIGNGDLHRIAIEPGDDINDLVNKLEYDPLTELGVPGLNVDYNPATGLLRLRPGMDDTNGGPDFGGDLRIIGGPGTTAAAINPALAALPSGVNILGALFGSYSVSGGVVTQTSPVESIGYQSETENGSGVFVAYRRDFLGANLGVGTDVLASLGIADYAQKIVNVHGQDVILNDTTLNDETTLRDLLQERFLSESGVNIDEELSMLIVIQTAYSAAARAVSAASEMFDELLNSIR